MHIVFMIKIRYFYRGPWLDSNVNVMEWYGIQMKIPLMALRTNLKSDQNLLVRIVQLLCPHVEPIKHSVSYFSFSNLFFLSRFFEVLQRNDNVSIIN